MFIIKKKMHSRTIIIVLSFLLILSTVIYTALFQEDNVIPIIKGIIHLNRDNSIAEISKEPKKYLTKSEQGSLPIVELMEDEGWQFDDQLGSGYIFSKDSKDLLIISRQYTRKYRIWEY